MHSTFIYLWKNLLGKQIEVQASFGVFLFVILCVLVAILVPILCIRTDNLQLAGLFALNVDSHFDTDTPVASDDPYTLHLTKGVVMPKAQAALSAMTFELPAMSSRMSPVFDQGALGSCVAQALVSAFD